MSFAASAPAAPVTTRTQLRLGTVVTITAWHEDLPAAEAAIEAAFAEIGRLQDIFDRHDGSTPLSVLNQQGSLKDAPRELAHVTAEALKIGHLTGHAFDMTVQPVVDYLRARKNPQGELLIDQQSFAEARALVRPDGVKISHATAPSIHLDSAEMGITLDAIAKGYIADKASAVLSSLGIGNHLVNAGGDIRAAGGKGSGPDAAAWIVGIEDPKQRGSALTAVPLRDRSLATSGGYELFYDRERRHHHLIDPATGQSPAVQSVSVLAPSTMEADALATALSILPPADALKLIAALPGRECLIIAADGALLSSPGWG